LIGRYNNFNKTWENKYLFINVNNKGVCLIYKASVAVSKQYNVERHFMTMHKDYVSKYPDNSEIRRNFVEDLKRNLRSRQAIFSKPVNKANAATIASYKITEILAKKKKPFEDGNVIKECLVVAGNSLLNEFKNKTEMCNTNKEVQLSRSTVTRRLECMSDNTEQQMRQDLEICEFSSLQLDESTDVNDVSQLLVFIRMVFNDGNIKEKLLKTIPLHGKTRGEDIFQSFYASLLEMNVPIHKLVPSSHMALQP
jgi:hypothetical protein